MTDSERDDREQAGPDEKPRDRWSKLWRQSRARYWLGIPLGKGGTCVDCRKGIAHKLPEGYQDDGERKFPLGPRRGHP